MPATFNDLTAEQKAAFRARVKTWGLTEADVQKHASSEPDKKAVICGIASLSNVKTKPFTINSVQHMKELVGIPDSAFKSGKMRDRIINYPPELPKERLGIVATAPNHCWVKENLTHEEHLVIKQAWEAYLVGNSEKISPGTVELINAVHFPAVVAVAAVENITVNPGQTYTFGSPGAPLQTIVVGTLTVLAGGSVAFASPCTLECQMTTAAVAPSFMAVAETETGPLTDPSPTDNNFTVYGPAPAPPQPPPPQGAKGQQQSATTGVATTSTGKNPTTTCTTASLPATPGDTGYTGTPGTGGQAGVTPPAVIAHLGVVTGVYNLYSGGGNAQDGGVGGMGGQGGQGGDGAQGASGKCNNQGPGQGGLGGTGGPGGMPGNAAPGTSSFFYYTSSTPPFSINIVNKGGFGGQPGLGGAGGGGGSGGADPAGVKGTGYNPQTFTLGTGPRGATGNNGSPGNNADAGSIQMLPEP